MQNRHKVHQNTGFGAHLIEKRMTKIPKYRFPSGTIPLLSSQDPFRKLFIYITIAQMESKRLSFKKIGLITHIEALMILLQCTP